MGDIVEIVTRTRHQAAFYKISTSALSFDVKGNGNAAIGLAKKPESKCDFWVVIGHNRRCWIRNLNCRDSPKVSMQRNVMSSDEYRRFWVAWDFNSVRLGRDGEVTPIVGYYGRHPELEYVTFSVVNEGEPVHWRFELPPILHKNPTLKPISNGKLHWVQANAQIPDNAVVGGHEKEILYIIRAPHRGSLTPGKFVPSLGVGIISWGGITHEKVDFEVLCGFDCAWVPCSENVIPVEAVVAGYSENASREPLYIGRLFHSYYYIPGKVQPSHKVCYAPYGNSEIGSRTFEILIEPTKKTNCANKVLVDHHNFGIESDDDYEDDLPVIDIQNVFHNDDDAFDGESDEDEDMND